jgi:hypothetical protein
MREIIAERRKVNHRFSRVDLPLPANRQRPEENEDEGKRMSRNRNRISKVIGAMGLLGMLVGLSAPRVSAESNPVISFSDAVYTGRYVCTTASRFDQFTAVIKYNPNGGGAYSAGTLIASLEPFDLDTDVQPPSMDFCTYFLDRAASSYTVGTDGTGFETLSWLTSPTNPTACPGSFIDQTSLALRDNTDITGAVLRAEISSANLLGQGSAGLGFCLK